jgi:hypothetical protein
MDAFNSFSKFKENIVQLDIMLESKKKECKDTTDKLSKEYNDLNQNLKKEYSDLNSSLQLKYAELSKKLDSDYKEHDRTLQNDYKNNMIEVKQKLKEFKLKACDEVLKEFGMMSVLVTENKTASDNLLKAIKDLDELQKTVDKQCNAIKQEEKGKYEAELKRQLATQELGFKATTAEMKAQLEQQKKEVDMLNKTIDNYKHEITEQRNLTKEIAQASAKSQINQKFGKD